MNKYFMQLINRYWIFATSLFLFCFLLLLGKQGFDLTDEGYVLYSYQNFFDSPQYVKYAFGTYLTSLFGGLWEMLFGFGGWYSFRILNSIIIVSAYVSICFLLRKYWQYKWIIFFSFFIVVISMTLDHGMLVFHYYTFSGFSNTVLGCLIYKSFEKENIRLLYFSSVLLALNIFVRIPNLTLCVIPYVLVILTYFYSKNSQMVWRRVVSITLGLLTGIFIMVALVYALGHDDLIINKMFELADTAQDTSNGHSISSMLGMTFLHFKSVLLYIIIIFVWFKILFLCCKSKCKICTHTAKFLMVISGVSVVAMYYLLPFFIQPISSKITFIYACLYSMSFFVAYRHYNKKETVILFTTFFMISILQPLGSDGIIGNMGAYSIWGLLPASFVLFRDAVKERKELQLVLLSPLWVTIVLLSFSIGKNVYRDCYRDEGDRLAKTYRVDASELATVLTSKERGTQMNSLLKECRKYMKRGDVVLFALDMPGMYYLTETKAWLDNPWPMLLNERTLEAKLKEHSERMVVVERDPQMFNSSAKLYYSSRYVIFQKFLKEHHYVQVWTNGTYRIYK